jgi:hypothetical protein
LVLLEQPQQGGLCTYHRDLSLTGIQVAVCVAQQIADSGEKIDAKRPELKNTQKEIKTVKENLQDATLSENEREEPKQWMITNPL